MATKQKAPPGGSGGALGGVGFLAVLLAATWPDQGVALAIRIIEQVGEDRCGEARVVELEGEVGPALVRLLRPGGPDLGATDEDPVAGSVVVSPIGLGNDADTLGLDAEGHDLALVLVAGLLEGTDVSHVTSPLLFEPATIAASMAICRPEVIDDAPARGPERSGGWRRSDFLASRGMGEAQGKKGEPTPLRLRRSRRSRPPPRSAKERPWVAPNSILGRRRGWPRRCCTRAPAHQSKRKRLWRRQRMDSLTGRLGRRQRSQPGLCR